MISKVSRVLKLIVTKIKFGKKVKIKGVPNMKFFTQIIVNKGKISIDKNFSALSNVSLEASEGKIIIGKAVFLNRNCILVSKQKIAMEDGSRCGPNVAIYDHDHRFGEHGIREGYNCGEVIIGKNVWIGAGCIILRNTTIGEGSVIGAGCVIKGDIPPYSLVTQERELKITKLEKRI